MLKAELLNIVRINKPPKKFLLDSVAEEARHRIVRLPPYHPELNPVELVWAQMKNKIADKNMGLSSLNTESAIEAALLEIDGECWEKVCSHVKKVEEQFIQNDPQVENVVESLIIRVGFGDESSSESDSEDSDSEGDNNSPGT